MAFKHRNRGNRRRDLEPPGVFKLLGFNLHFNKPENPRGKKVERTFADLSREIDTGPWFRGAHAGSNPGERPEGKITPVEWDRFVRVYGERIAEYNARKGRKSRACKATGTRSYNDAFEAMRAGRPPKVLPESQLRLATMEWTLTTVQPDGRVRGQDGWVYGEDLDDGSQDKLLRFKGRKVWVGTDPLDRSKPALVWNPETDRIIMDGVHAVIRGKFADKEGARRAARKEANLRKALKRVEKIDTEVAVAQLDILSDDPPDPGVKSAKVVSTNFRPAVRPATNATEGDVVAPLAVSPIPETRRSAVPEEFLANMDRMLARQAAGRT